MGTTLRRRWLAKACAAGVLTFGRGVAGHDQRSDESQHENGLGGSHGAAMAVWDEE